MKAHYVSILSIFFLSYVTEIGAQGRNKKQKSIGVVKLNDSLTTYRQSNIFEFPYISKYRFYHNQKAINEIDRLDKIGRDALLYATLKKYVYQFGIENFSKNAPMLWRLAQLSEKYGTPGEAILLYRLVLKHHQQGIDIKNLLHVYDSIEINNKELYVPLDYYYRLVDLRKEIDTLRPPHGVLLNMGDAINSPSEDYGPTIGNMDNMLLFTSKRNVRYIAGDRIIDEDIFFSKNIDEFWEMAKGFDAINTTYNEGSACLSLDGQFLFFSRCNAPNSLGNCDIYVSTLNKDSLWSAGKNLGATVNSYGWDSHPSLSHTGDTLFFASNRTGGFGLSDIYFAIKGTDSVWLKAQNAGPIINTRNSEVSPFFHHRFNVLYFGSNGQPINFGEFDIYKSYLQEKHWSEPKNIGPLVNGEGSEYYFTIDSDSKFLYYSRSVEENLQNLDLHSFPVPMEAQPEATAHLKGSLKNQVNVGNPMKGIVSIIDLDHGTEVAPKFLRPDGSFDFDLINKRNYLLIIQGDKFFRFEEIFFMDGDIEINRYAEPIENRIEFESLEFEKGKSNILESMHSDLHKIANFLTDHPGLKLIIHGHTDSTGKEESNLTLSKNRARAIKEFIINKFSVQDSRIQSIGYGSSNPIVEEISEQDKQLNRRVEFEMYRDR